MGNYVAEERDESTKTIHIFLEDAEHKRLSEKKGKESWHDFIMRMAK